MRISHIELVSAEIPYTEPFAISLGSSNSTENLFVRIHTDDGIYGTGEGSPTRRITGETLGTMLEVGRQLSKLLLGENPRDIAYLVQKMRSLFVFNTTARCAFDMALYDLAAKAEVKPLYAYLGGSRRAFWTDNTIGIDDPDRMARKAVSYLEDGFQAIKVKLGTTPEADIERIKSIRSAVGDTIPLRVDANQGWSPEEAIEVLREITPLGIEYCEQPVKYWDHEGMRVVREAVAIPIMADESIFDVHDAGKLAERGSCDYFNIKLAKSSGILGGMKIADFAEKLGIACMVGSMSETRLGLSAAAHLVSARTIIRFADLDTHFDHSIDPVVGGVRITGAEVEIPEAPGHGADLAPEFLASAPTILIV